MLSQYINKIYALPTFKMLFCLLILDSYNIDLKTLEFSLTAHGKLLSYLVLFLSRTNTRTTKYILSSEF